MNSNPKHSGQCNPLQLSTQPMCQIAGVFMYEDSRLTIQPPLQLPIDCLTAVAPDARWLQHVVNGYGDIFMP